MEEIIFGPSEFVGVLNQTLEYAYPSVMIQGELANLRVSKNRWVYFDLKDDFASVKFFGTVYQLPGPLEDGMLVQVRGLPRLHQQYGFSVNVQFMQPVGEGSIKKAAALLEAKLAAEGLFAPERKRLLPYPPRRIGLIASSESAAYHDFVKVLNYRWGGIEIRLADVQVQGEPAVMQIVAALDYFNMHGDGVDVLVITRGGGSPEDLAAFSSEQVTRAVAASRIPTLVAIGHEVDISLGELAADKRASTPSNAAELLVPDKRHILEELEITADHLALRLDQQFKQARYKAAQASIDIYYSWKNIVRSEHQQLKLKRQVLLAFDPTAALKRGYAVVRSKGKVVRSGKQLKKGQSVGLQFSDATAEATINDIQVR